MSAAFDSQAVAAKPLASLSSPERSHLKATLDKQHELIKDCFAEALAAAGSYASLVALNDAIVVNGETEQQYELDGEHAPDHARLRGDLAAAMAKGGPGGQAGAAWVGAFRAKYDAHDEAFDEPAFGSLQAPSHDLASPPAPSPSPLHLSYLIYEIAAACPPHVRPAASLAPPLTPLPPACRAGQARRAAVADAAALDRHECEQHAAPLLDARLDVQEGEVEPIAIDTASGLPGRGGG